MIRTGQIGVSVVGLVAVLVVGCAGSGADKAGGHAPKPLVLTLADPLGDPTEVDGFAAEVARLSHGTMRIKIDDRWRYGEVAYENGLISDVRAGKADLGIAGSRAWDSFGVLGLRALQAPLLIDSYALQQRVLRRPLVAQTMKEIAPLGLVGLGLLPGPLRHPFGITRALLTPSDYAGLRIGVQQSRVASETFRALDATSTWIPAGGPNQALGGVEQALSAVSAPSYPRHMYLTANVVLWPRPLVVFGNRAAFAKLTSTERHVLLLAVGDDVPPETTSVRNDEQFNTANLCRGQSLRFMTASAADRAALRRAVQPVYDQLDRDAHTRRFIAQIEAMSTNTTPEPAPWCTPQAPVRPHSGTLDGVYQYNVTYADLRAAHPVPGELIPENVGTYTWVLDRGHFATTTENSQACTWGYGTFTVRGDVLLLFFTNGGGIAPTGANIQPGENPSMNWSRYHGLVTMRKRNVPNTGAPTGFVAKPWRLISITPSARYLPARCAPPANAPPG